MADGGGPFRQIHRRSDTDRRQNAFDSGFTCARHAFDLETDVHLIIFRCSIDHASSHACHSDSAGRGKVKRPSQVSRWISRKVGNSGLISSSHAVEAFAKRPSAPDFRTCSELQE